jgi:hypothetical protein
MSEHSILFKPAAIATLANENALDDLHLFFKTLELWNPVPPPVYLLCTESVKLWSRGKYQGSLHTCTKLEAYRSLSRREMEVMPSKKGLPNLFYDFTQEKCDLMDWALSSIDKTDEARGVLFCDADIFWLGPLPQIPEGYSLALSRHGIRDHDEAKFGKYNAGFLWTNMHEIPSLWREACKTSRFFEQAALETLAERTNIYEFGSNINYGWWRMYQGTLSAEKKKAEWTIKRDPKEGHSGLCLQGEPVLCIHTHWKTDDFITREFNTWIRTKLALLKSQKRVAHLLRLV